MSEEPKAVHIIVHGDVQGVGFRAFTQRRAQNLGLNGWTRNNYDNTVEIWAEGAQTQLESFIQSVQQGPPSGYVERLDIQWHPAKRETTRFQIRY
ncbi:MAG: acylphosphatase [Anaerolineae bacterium]|nr:acylphosphatase [Anaerolineae bacterium]